jgi:hypothetical protein
MKVAEAARNAPEKKREIRERTMRLEVAGHRQEVRAYLRDLYTNAANQMICQCCRQEMPFKLLDGETPYFEAVEFLKECSRELVENYIALCPVCAAKFQHARATTDEELRAALPVTSVDNVSVSLAGTDEAIRFVRQHRDDLIAALSATWPSHLTLPATTASVVCIGLPPRDEETIRKLGGDYENGVAASGVGRS